MVVRSTGESVTTTPPTLQGVTFTKTETTITAAFNIQPGQNRYGIEIVNGSGVIIRRKSAWTGDLPGETAANTPVTATITGLTGGTSYICNGYAGDETLADI